MNSVNKQETIDALFLLFEFIKKRSSKKIFKTKKLSFIELYVMPRLISSYGKYWEDEGYYSVYNKQIQAEIKECINNKDYERTNIHPIYKKSKVDNEKICFKVFLRGTSYESDISYPDFTFVDELNLWIVIEDFWGSPTGVTNDGTVFIFDPSDLLFYIRILYCFLHKKSRINDNIIREMASYL
jgi:hypothetical protein